MSVEDGPTREPRLRAVIADDEVNLAVYLRDRLAMVWPELEIVAMAANGAEALHSIERYDADIAFLDIRMPGLTGVEVASRVGRDVHLVFVTAYEEYAVQAFEREAIDYLIKPVTDQRLSETVRRIRERLHGAPAPGIAQAFEALRKALPALAGSPSGLRLAWIRAAVGQQVRLIAVDEVSYFQSNDKYTSVFTSDSEALIRTPLKELLAQLDPDRFWQIHRGTIVNVAHIATSTRDLSGRTLVKLRSRPEILKVSRAFAHLFRQM